MASCSNSVLIARKVQFRVVEQSLIMRQRAFRLFELHLIRARVDLDQNLPFLHQIALIES